MRKDGRQQNDKELQSFAFWGVGLFGVLLAVFLVWYNAATAPRPLETWVTLDSAPVLDPYPELTGMRIHINRAGIEELMLLPNIGENRAKAIIEYRNQIGVFYAPEQLLEIEGIGKSTLDLLLPYLVFD